MFFNLTGAVKRRLINELRRYWSYHPKYRDIVDNIQGSYSFETRPQLGMIVKSGSGSQFVLSADNFVGTGHSYITLAGVGEYPGISIEWVVEDSQAIANNGGVFPTAPGIYFIEITSADEFYVDPMIDHRNEAVSFLGADGALLQPPVAGSLRLYEEPNRFQLVEGINYTVDTTTGALELLAEIPSGHWVSADYRSQGGTTGPHKYMEHRTNHTAIPGVVLAFGDRAEVNDRLAVHVTARREPAYLEYGGRWDLSFDVDIITRDIHAQEAISDQTIIYLWGVARSRLSSEGLEMTDLSLGGASEEVYDENADDYFYNNSFSLTIQTEWHVRQPLTAQLRAVSDVSPAIAEVLAGDAEADVITGIQAVEDLGLRDLGDPYFAGKTRSFEVIR